MVSFSFVSKDDEDARKVELVKGFNATMFGNTDSDWRRTTKGICKSSRLCVLNKMRRVRTLSGNGEMQKPRQKGKGTGMTN